MSRKIMLTLCLLVSSIFILSAVTLDGLVISGETAQPVAGALLTLHQGNMNFVETTTNEAGEFIFEDLTEGNYMLHAQAEEFQTFMEMMEIQEDLNITIELIPEDNGGVELTGHLFGNVTNEDGSPAADQEMVISTWNQNSHPHNQTYETVTDESGNYDFVEIVDFADYQVMILTGQSPFQTEVYVEGDTEFDIVLEEYDPGEVYTLSGTVTNLETGESLAGVEIMLNGNQGMHHNSVSGEDGSYAFTEITAGEYHLTAYSNEMNFYPYDEMIEIQEDTVLNIELTGWETGDLTLSGIITEDESGEPVPDVTVHLWGDNMQGMNVGTSDENGYYEINDIMAGVYQLVVTAHHNNTLFEAEIEIAENTVFDIVLEGEPAEEGNLSGNVIDGETGEFVAGAQIYLQHGWDAYETISGDDGQYSFNNITTQNYQLVVFAEGYNRFNENVEVEEETVFDISLEPEITGDFSLSGEVTDAQTGELLSDVHIQLFSDQGMPYNAFTNDDGFYEIDGIFAGTCQMMAWVMDWNSYEPFEATLEITEDTVFNFEMTPFEVPGAGNVIGTVFDSNTGEPVVDAFLHLAPLDGNGGGGGCWQQYQTESDDDGNFEFNQVEEGEYILAAEAEGYIFSFFDGVTDPDEATVIEVVENEVVTVEMHLTPLVFYAVSGNVSNYISGEAMEDVFVTAITPGTGCNNWAVAEAYTDAEGNYALELAQGEYMFVAEYGDHHSEDYMQQFFDHKQSPANADIVTVDQDIAGIDFEMAAPENYDNQISGTITVENEIPDNPVLVAAVSGNDQWEAAVVTDMFGNYSLENLPEGEFYILAYEYNSVPTYYPGVIDFEDALLVYAQGNVTDIDFDLIMPESNGLFQVDGYVTNDNNEPVTNANVVILDESGDVLSFAVTNSDGYYQVNGLPAGDLTGLATKVLYDSDQDNVYVTTTGNADFVINPRATTAAPEDNVSPAVFSLSNYPNPFNPTTTISFSLPQADQVSLAVYNVSGQKIITLVDAQLSSGVHNVNWNGLNSDGSNAASGIYFYKLCGKDFSATQKMILMK